MTWTERGTGMNMDAYKKSYLFFMLNKTLSCFKSFLRFYTQKCFETLKHPPCDTVGPLHTALSSQCQTDLIF